MKFKFFKDLNSNSSDYISWQGSIIVVVSIMVILFLFTLIKTFVFVIIPLALVIRWWYTRWSKGDKL